VEAETCDSYAEPDFRAAALRRKRAARRRAKALCADHFALAPLPSGGVRAASSAQLEACVQ